jgi:aminomethyltransferase
MSTKELGRTPLFSWHVEAGAKMVPFAGWEMPVQYSGLREEHLSVRRGVGLFDVSHMGEIRVRGPRALASLQWMLSNDVAQIGTGQAQYSLLMNPRGGVVDDVIVYCLERDADYLVCVNAANTDKDWDWVQSQNQGAEIENQSAKWGQIAVQGPKAVPLLAEVLGDPGLVSLPKNGVKRFRDWGEDLIVARTGYTGEDGCEIFVMSDRTVDLWQEILRAGRRFEARPIGLGARDTLRMEAKYPLYGQELTDDTSPAEAGLGWAVKYLAKDFVGREAYRRVLEAGPRRKLIGLRMLEKAIPRAGYPVLDAGEPIGTITSGTLSPTLDEGIGIGYVRSDLATIGHRLEVAIRSRRFPCEVVKTPFVKKTEGA